ncbi:FHA domain-containing protein [Archangium minus]|uniref:FHA domain-containing protein n=1 Tax=Archangium minus TaxID=83450 RepID=A0ABY9WRL2_9BACT|nr:FHA domain-containing protein [Archangium minus]
MSNGSPPARRRPTSGSPSGGAAGSRPPVRRTSTSTAVRPEPTPEPVLGTKLVCAAGPCAGQEFGLEDGEYVVGRANDNPICIPDTSVSRRHVLIRRVGGGWAASDLGSGNGTLLNGEPLTDEMPLSHGDTLTLGDTELTFNDTSNATMMMPMPSAPPSRPARSRPAARPAAAPVADAGDEAEGGGEVSVPRRPPPRPEGRVRSSRGRAAMAAPDPKAQQRKKRLLILAVGVFVMLVGLLAIMKVQQQREEELLRNKARIAQERREQIDALFQEAKNLIRDGKWSDAKVKLLELQEVEPNHVQLPDYLARVQKEIPNQEALDDAKAALEKNQLGPAAAALAKVSKDTQLFELVRTLRVSLNDKADKRVREAQALLEQKQIDQAKAITDDVLAAHPDHRDAKVINEQAAQAIAIRDAPPPPPTPKEAPKPWDQAVDRFRDGDLQGAMAIANACAAKHAQCKTLMGQLTDFGILYKKLEDLDAKGLARLLDLDKKITNGRGSKLSRTAGTRAANIFFKSASAAKAAGQYGRAMDNAQRALQADPGHVGASNIVGEMRAKAKDVYMQAYALKDTEPEDAVVKFKEAMAMSPPEDETHQKAKSWVEKLQR